MERQVIVEFEDGMRQDCRSAIDLALHVGDLCITRYKNAHDYGRVTKLRETPVDDNREGRAPVVIRRATLQDQAKAVENAVHGRMAIATCRRRLTEAEGEMHLLHVRYNFDRTLLIVSFSAEERADFRDLIKTLSQDLSVHIEMRQVGVRDAAGRTGGMGPCGRVLCCHQWLRKFEAINVKMAKKQNISLSSSSISGMCGRLKCCLRYEFDNYRAMDRKVPAVGSMVETPEGQGVVSDRNLLASMVTVQLEDQRMRQFPADSVRKQNDSQERLDREQPRKAAAAKETRKETNDPPQGKAS